MIGQNDIYTVTFHGPALAICEVCGMPLDADNVYGEEDYPLCRDHHELFWKTVKALAAPKTGEPMQPSLFQEGKK